MTYRIGTSQGDEEARILFEGLLDRGALDEVLAFVATARESGPKAVRLVLGVGTTVEGGLIPRLCAIDALTVVTVSPFLAYWLRQQGIRVEP